MAITYYKIIVYVELFNVNKMLIKANFKKQINFVNNVKKIIKNLNVDNC